MKSPTLDIFCNEAVRDYFYKAAGHELVPDVEQRLRFHIVRPFECVSAGPYRVTPLPAKHMDTEQALFYLIERRAAAFCTPTIPAGSIRRCMNFWQGAPHR